MFLDIELGRKPKVRELTVRNECVEERRRDDRGRETVATRVATRVLEVEVKMPETWLFFFWGTMTGMRALQGASLGRCGASAVQCSAGKYSRSNRRNDVKCLAANSSPRCNSFGKGNQTCADDRGIVFLSCTFDDGTEQSRCQRAE